MLGGSLTPLFERLSGAVIDVTITPSGKVVEVKGYKELIGDLLQGNDIAKQFAGGGSDEAAKAAIGETFPTLSTKAVSPGDKWEEPFTLQLPQVGKVTGKKIYWYQGSGEVGKLKTAKISVATEMSVETNIMIDGAKVTGTISVSSSKGTIHFDPQKGCLVALDSEQTVSGNLNVSVNNMDIPVTLEQVERTTVDLIDELPK
jgi:hypothetical protein